MTKQLTSPFHSLLHPWPIDRPADWTRRVNAAITQKERDRLERCEQRERPYGDPAWVARTVRKHGLQHTVRPQGRPKKERVK